MHQISMDRSKPLAEQPTCGHNRFHPDIEPVVEVEEGEEVAMETLDALDGQLPPTATVDNFAAINAGAVHPLTGPIYVKGAEPGDELEIEFLDIEPELHAFSCIMPGMGFLRDIFDEPFLVHWKIRDGWATSDQIPEVCIPGASFMGVSGVAPSADLLQKWTDREQRLLDKGGLVFPPDPEGAVPTGPCGLQGLRTVPHGKMVATST